jgi:hypothetical protein
VGFRFEAVEPDLQGLNRDREGGELDLQLGEALCCGGGVGSVRLGAVERCVCSDGGQVGSASEQVGVAGFAGAGLAREDGGEWTCGFAAGCIGDAGRWACGQTVKSGQDSGQVVEGIQTVGAAAELAWGLGATQHEEAEDGGLVAAEVENGADAMLVLGDAGIANRGSQGEVFEGVEGLANLVFSEIEDGIAAGALVARIDQSVEGEGIVLRSGDLFFDERAEDAELDGVELHVNKGAIDGVRVDIRRVIEGVEEENLPGSFKEIDMTRKLHRRDRGLGDELVRLEEGNDEW